MLLGPERLGVLDPSTLSGTDARPRCEPVLACGAELGRVELALLRLGPAIEAARPDNLLTNNQRGAAAEGVKSCSPLTRNAPIALCPSGPTSQSARSRAASRLAPECVFGFSSTTS